MFLVSTSRKIVSSDSFHTLVIWAIVGCSILLGIETYYPASNRYFIFFDVLFSLFFIVEILLRIFAAGSLLKFFGLFDIVKGKNDRAKIRIDEVCFWNWFDFLIVIFTSISLFKHFVEHPEFLIVSRLFRVLRIFRLLEVSSELKQVEKRIISIIPTVFSFVLLLGILMYIYAIIGVYLFEHQNFEQANFSTLTGAFMTLFQLMTLDGWTDVMKSADSSLYSSWLTKGYFVSFVIFTAIISFNVFVAVLTSQVHEKMLAEVKESKSKKSRSKTLVADEKMEEILLELRTLREEIKQINSSEA